VAPVAVTVYDAATPISCRSSGTQVNDITDIKKPKERKKMRVG
jgi:hypothetical protein